MFGFRQKVVQSPPTLEQNTLRAIADSMATIEFEPTGTIINANPLFFPRLVISWMKFRGNIIAFSVQEKKSTHHNTANFGNHWLKVIVNRALSNVIRKTVNYWSSKRRIFLLKKKGKSRV